MGKGRSINRILELTHLQWASMVQLDADRHEKRNQFRFSQKGGKIPRYNLGEIISPTFDIVSKVKPVALGQ